MNAPARALLALIAALVLVSAACGDDPPTMTSTDAAQAQPPAPPVVPVIEPLHAWVVVPRADGKECVIFHVPPRTGPAGAKLGVAYIAERLVGVPRGIAAWGTRAYIVTDPEEVGASRHRRVYTINARYEGAWGWSYQPENRLGVLPSLPPDGQLEAIVADSTGASALLWIEGPAGGPGTWQMWRLDGVTAPEWVTAALPWDAPGGESPLRGMAGLVELEGRTVAVALRPKGMVATAIEGWTRQSDGTWTRTIGPEAAPLPWTPDADALAGLDGRIVEVVSGIEGISVNAVWPLARKGIAAAPSPPEKPGSPVGYGVLERGVIVALWRAPADNEGGGRRAPEAPVGMPGAGVVAARADVARFKIAELSTRTGRVLAEGAVRQPTPLADRPLHLIALTTAAFMAGLLLFTLRRGEATELPAPFYPGGLARRAVASATDLAVGLGLAGVLWHVTPAELLTVQTLLGSVQDAAPIWTALGLTAVHSALAEMTVGGSIGKVAVGCRVGVVAREAEGSQERIKRASAWAVVVRNLIKWTLLPAAALAAFDPLHRHAADVVAGTVVVDLPDEPSAPEGSEGPSDG